MRITISGIEPEEIAIVAESLVKSADKINKLNIARSRAKIAAQRKSSQLTLFTNKNRGRRGIFC